jgi:hypothetical protein
MLHAQMLCHENCEHNDILNFFDAPLMNVVTSKETSEVAFATTFW